MRKATFARVAALLVALGATAGGGFACDFVWP